MQQSPGLSIRQLRRERSITQTQLGGDRYSKSYVSAVERGKIIPTTAALRLFAQQLGQPEDKFVQLFQQSEDEQAALLVSGSTISEDSTLLRHELTFLDSLLERSQLHDLSPQQEVLQPSPALLAQLPSEKRARYCYLVGVLAQKQGDYNGAIEALETALALAEEKYRRLILDELGNCYSQLRIYQSALVYHLRALQALNANEEAQDLERIRFRVELHCGFDYLSLGAYDEALDHLNRARNHLQIQQDMMSAGLLYWGLGYCTYMMAYQQTFFSSTTHSEYSLHVLDQQYQRAISFLIQSKSIYQISGEVNEEVRLRLMLTMVILDSCNLRRKIALQRGDDMSNEVLRVNINSLLEDAVEQCKQVLIGLRENASLNLSAVDVEKAKPLWIALAYLIRVLLQRAALARRGGGQDTAIRERSVATYLCTQMMSALKENRLPLPLILSAGNVADNPQAYQYNSLPTFPTVDGLSKSAWNAPEILSEVCLSAGEVNEEFGRAAETADYAEYCYIRADSYFQASLEYAQKYAEEISLNLSLQGEVQGYLFRAYQHYISLLEERMQVEEHAQAFPWLDVLKRSLRELQTHFSFVQKEAAYHARSV
jgi:tetratricopeptide (TPR) repeat protein